MTVAVTGVTPDGKPVVGERVKKTALVLAYSGEQFIAWCAGINLDVFTGGIRVTSPFQIIYRDPEKHTIIQLEGWHTAPWVSDILIEELHRFCALSGDRFVIVSNRPDPSGVPLFTNDHHTERSDSRDHLPPF